MMNCFILNPGLLIALFALSCFSCNSDDYMEPMLQETYNPTSEITQKGGNSGPENLQNPYDSIGIRHNILLHDFQNHTITPLTIQDVVEHVNALTSYHHAINLSGFLASQELEHIQNILEDPEGEFLEALSQSSLSNQAKDSLTSFVSYLEMHAEDEYSSLYDYMISFEEEIAGNTSFLIEEKRILLSFTSFVRHSVYYEKRRDDKDWDVNVTSLVGGFEGSLFSAEGTVYWGLLLGICYNYL